MAERKTMTFACIHFTVAFSVAWAVTGSPVIGGVLAVVEPLVNTIAFYLHERVWQRVQREQDAEISSGVRVTPGLRPTCC